jgi:hypothetical protein
VKFDAADWFANAPADLIQNLRANSYKASAHVLEPGQTHMEGYEVTVDPQAAERWLREHQREVIGKRLGK